MANTLRTTITGIPEFAAQMRKLKGAFDPAELRPVLLVGAEAIREPVRVEASFSSLTGAMNRALIAKLHSNPSEAVAYMAVDYKQLQRVDKKGRKVRYPFILEYGAGPHLIKGSPVLSIGGKSVRAEVRHPGFRGRHFFRSGVAKGRAPAKREIERLLVSKIEALS